MSRNLHVTVVPDLSTVSPAEWDALAPADNPFLDHAFLRALETSGSVGERTGWLPAHVLVRRAGALVGAAPLYVKTHSYGEYIFDWGWADAAERAGLRYYPKLVSAIPHTPATGRRLLVEGGATDGPVLGALVAGIRDLADTAHASSIHVLFLTREEREALASGHGLLPRLTYQFHWHNRGYGSFDDFLSSLRSVARKQIRRERRGAADSGLRLRTLSGPELEDRDWEAIYAFYLDTARRRGAIPYLTRSFFQEVRRTLPHRVVATMAHDGDAPVAAALSFRKGAHLYGRYWGCSTACDFLHFELCYYRPIELCIAEGMTLFEAGAQGEHKLKRGFLPEPTYSAHWLRHDGLSEAVAAYLEQEARATEGEMRWLAGHGPFRREP